MHALPLPRTRRYLVAPLALLAPAALLAAAIIPALNPPSHASPALAAPQSITIRASDAHFPTKIAAGMVVVTLVNDSKGPAEASFARAAAGATVAQIKAANAQAQQSVASFIQLTHLLTFIGGANTIPPGTTETAVLNMRTPGLYGVDVTFGNGPDKLITFTVTAGQGQAAVPTGIPVTLKDMKFVGLPARVASGPVSFQITNQGPEVHEMSLVRLDSGKTQKDVVNYLHTPQGQNGPPAWAEEIGGMDALSPHQVANLRLNLQPGYYVAICMMPDVKKQGEPHLMEGMITHFIVR